MNGPANRGEDEALHFLQLLGKDPEASRFRFFAHKKNPRKAEIGARKEHRYNRSRFERLLSEGRSAYVVIGEGGDNKESIIHIPALFVEWDDKPREWQIHAWIELKLPQPSMQVETGGGSIHNYWLLKEPLAPEQWIAATQRLIAHCGSDPAVSDPSRVMRLPGFDYIGADGKPTGHCQLISTPGTRYRLVDVLTHVPELPSKQAEEGHKSWASKRQQTSATVQKPWPSRGLEEINAAAAFIPKRVGGEGTYPNDRNALCGCSAALAEASVADPDEAALALLGHLWPSETAARQVLESTTTRNSASFWAIAREHGYITRVSPNNPQRSEQRTYSHLTKAMLDATKNGQEDELMELRAEIISRFRMSDAQIESSLFKLHSRRELGIVEKQQPESLDLNQIAGMEWLIEGFVPDHDLTLVWGEAGTGKSTAALAMAKTVIDGTGLLDHTHPARRGKVLFIASDSGAVPLYAAMQDMGMADLPEAQPGENQSLFVWAADPDQGMTTWAANLAGCIRLLDFVKRRAIDLVLIDSCKAVCSGADLDYSNNQLVTSLLTYFKEVICPHSAVVWLNHDGVAKGAHAGAKAWKEIPSMVHRIMREEERSGTPINTRRMWRVTKSRMGPCRDFAYEINQGDLRLCQHQEQVGNCLDRVTEVLWGALLQGQDSLSRADLIDRICRHGGPSRKTLDNTLSTSTKAKHPEICRVRGRRGHYKLSPRVEDALKGCISNRKEEGQNPLSDFVLLSSRQVPAGTPPHPQPHTRVFPWENVGNSQDPLHCSRSQQICSQDACTPLPGEQHAHEFKEEEYENPDRNADTRREKRIRNNPAAAEQADADRIWEAQHFGREMPDPFWPDTTRPCTAMRT